MRKFLCRLGFHKWIVRYKQGIVYAHPVERRCAHCRKHQRLYKLDERDSTGYIYEKWMSEFDYIKYKESDAEKTKFINGK